MNLIIIYCLYFNTSTTWRNILSGATEFGAVGTCWGSYMVLRECAYDEVGITCTKEMKLVSDFVTFHTILPIYIH